MVMLSEYANFIAHALKTVFERNDNYLLYAAYKNLSNGNNFSIKTYFNLKYFLVMAFKIFKI